VVEEVPVKAVAEKAGSAPPVKITMQATIDPSARRAGDGTNRVVRRLLDTGGTPLVRRLRDYSRLTAGNGQFNPPSS
jgi:hypothetical protein